MVGSRSYSLMEKLGFNGHFFLFDFTAKMLRWSQKMSHRKLIQIPFLKILITKCDFLLQYDTKYDQKKIVELTQPRQ